MISRIIKRDGKIVDFKLEKITTAIYKALKATNRDDYRLAEKLSGEVLLILERRYGEENIPGVEDIQDVVEYVLVDNKLYETAKAYILYRQKHKELRELKKLLDPAGLIETYLRQADWLVRENSNMSFSLQGLNSYIVKKVVSEYWLTNIYPKEIAQAHRSGDFHIHDLDFLGAYTYSGKEIILAKISSEFLLTSFEQLYELIAEKESALSEKDEAYAKYPKELLVLDKNGWTRVLRVVRKRKNRPMLFVKNRGGRSIIVTDNHPMITENGEKEAKDVIIDKDRIFTVNLSSLLEKEDLWCIQYIDLLREIKKYGWISERDRLFFNGEPLDNFRDEERDGYIHTIGFISKRKIELTQKFGYFIGFTLAEGYLSYNEKEPRCVSLTQKDKKLLLKANEGLIENGMSGCLIKREDRFELQVKNPFLRFLFEKVFKIKPGAKNKILPINILSYNKDFVDGLIAGILDGDGSIDTSRTTLSLRISSRSLLEQMALLMQLLGFIPRDRNIEGEGSIREFNGKKIVQNYPIYGLSFRKTTIDISSEKYIEAELSTKAWHDETRNAWHKIINKKEVNIPDEFIYDITTESGTLVVNGMWNHNCVGWDIEDLLLTGFGGVSGKIESKPARHFRSALGQVVNFFFTLQGESAGAQAFSNFDTYLSPFIRYDNMDYRQVKQSLQEFLFNMNVPTRVGFQCMSEDTEILGRDGWKKHNQVKEGDKIATFNVDGGFLEYLSVKHVFAREYKGKMYNLKNRISNQLISPEHRVVRKKFNSERYVLEKVEDVLKLKSPFMVPIGSGGNIKGDVSESVDVIKLIAWVVSEGSLDKSGRGDGRISIYQSKVKSSYEYEEIIAICHNLGLKYTERTQQGLGDDCNVIRFDADSTRKILNYFDSNKERGIKFIPNIILNANTESSRLFIETYIQGDGYDACKIVTSSKAIRDGLLQVIVNAGYGATVLVRKPDNELSKKDRFIIRVIKHKDTYIEKIEEVEYEGIIWCPNTENETVVARRNGKIFITGNTPFTNITLDLKVPDFMKHKAVIIGGELKNVAYGELQKEMDMFNKAFSEVMAEGDAKRRPFTFPIPTYNITKDFEWDNENYIPIWEMTRRYGIPYFSNFVNSDMKPEDARSMCCRLRLDLKQLAKRGGGLFGSNPLTGSIGVVTINMPRIAYLSRTEDEFLERLGKLMEMAKETLIIKRKLIEKLTDTGLYPYSRHYLRDIKKRFGEYWKNHFSTIGLIGMNEACLNFEPLRCSTIGDKKGREFALRVLNFMRGKLLKFQEEEGDNYNLEATPAEGASHSLALLDKERFPDIISQGSGSGVFYTNSSQLPVDWSDDIFEVLDLQDEVQCKYTGGCISKGNKVLTDKGLIPIEEIVENFKKLNPIKVLSYNPEKRISEWDEVVEAVSINVKKHNKIRIIGERNLDITTSDWHPFFVLEKFKPNPVCPICETKVGNIKGFAVHLRWHQECREKYKTFPKYRVVEKRADELKPRDYILQNFTNIYPEKESELNNDLMWLVGFFIGDGCISKFVDNRGGNNLVKYKVRFHSESEKALEKVAKILNRYFGCNVKVIKNDKRSEVLREVETFKKDVAEFFFRYGFWAGKKAYDIYVPQKVKENLIKGNVYAFISGLMDSDGTLGKRDGDFEYETVSSKLANDLLEIFTKAGIMVSKSLKKTKRKNEVNIWRLRIPQYEMTKVKDELNITVHPERIRSEFSNRKKRFLPVVRVKKVSKVDVEDNQFYDLMAAKNHNYLAGKDCLVFVHNTVIHIFLGESLTDYRSVENLVKKVIDNYKLPYFTITPTFSICPIHGYIPGEYRTCPICEEEKKVKIKAEIQKLKCPDKIKKLEKELREVKGTLCEVFSRSVGYLRPTSQWNEGKQEEFKKRKTFKV